MNIVVDESMYDPQRNAVEKEPSAFEEDGTDNHLGNPDIVLLTGSKICSGSGKAVACSVGDQTRLSRSRSKEDSTGAEAQTYFGMRLA